MTTGYLAAGACWPTANEAIDAYYSSYKQFGVQNNGTYIFYPINVGGVWKISQTLVNGTTSVYQALPTNVYGSCTIETAPHYSPPYPTALTCTNCSGGTGSGTSTPVELWNGTYDYAAAAAAWSFAFVTVMGTWLIAKNIGTILSAIKRW